MKILRLFPESLLVLLFMFICLNVSFGQEKKDKHNMSKKEYKEWKEKFKSERQLHVPKSGFHFKVGNGVGLSNVYRTIGLDLGVGYRINKSTFAINSGLQFFTSDMDSYRPLSLEYRYYRKNESASGFVGLRGTYKLNLAAIAAEPFVGFRLPAYKKLHWTLSMGLELIYDNIETRYEGYRYTYGFFSNEFLPDASDLRKQVATDNSSLYAMIKFKIGLEF